MLGALSAQAHQKLIVAASSSRRSQNPAFAVEPAEPEPVVGASLHQPGDAAWRVYQSVCPSEHPQHGRPRRAPLISTAGRQSLAVVHARLAVVRRSPRRFCQLDVYDVVLTPHNGTRLPGDMPWSWFTRHCSSHTPLASVPATSLFTVAPALARFRQPVPKYRWCYGLLRSASPARRVR